MSNKRINARIQKWRIMMKQGVSKDKQLLRSRIRKGIPQAIRALAWPAIVNLRQFQQYKAGLYTYQKLINTPSKSTYDITLDIPRTFPEEEDSKILRKSLNNVLKAISIVHKKMGYCQGMNFLALRLLQVLDDQETFWLLNYLLENDRSLMKNFVDPKMIEEESGVFSELLRIYAPKINSRLLQLNITIHIFTVKWFMTIFSSSLSQEVFYRIFQIYLSQGWSMLYKVGLTLLRNHEHQIEVESFDNIIKIINTDINHISDIDDFIIRAYEIQIPYHTLQQIQTKYFDKRDSKELSSAKNYIFQRITKAASFQFPKPQHQPQQDLQFQRKAQEVTFQVFNLMKVHKK